MRTSLVSRVELETRRQNLDFAGLRTDHEARVRQRLPNERPGSPDRAPRDQNSPPGAPGNQYLGRGARYRVRWCRNSLRRFDGRATRDPLTKLPCALLSPFAEQPCTLCPPLPLPCRLLPNSPAPFAHPLPPPQLTSTLRRAGHPRPSHKVTLCPSVAFCRTALHPLPTLCHFARSRTALHPLPLCPPPPAPFAAPPLPQPNSPAPFATLPALPPLPPNGGLSLAAGRSRSTPVRAVLSLAA